MNLREQLILSDVEYPSQPQNRGLALCSLIAHCFALNSDNNLRRKIKKRVVTLFLIFSLILLFISSVSAQTYVKQTATGSASGANWDNALGSGDLDDAIESGGTVYIAAGLYTPGEIFLTTNTPHIVQGGFPASATGTDLSGYNPVLNQTVIDGGTSERIFDNPSIVDNIELRGLILQNADATSGSVFRSSFSDSGPIDFKFIDLEVRNNVASDDGSFRIYDKDNLNSGILFENCYFHNNQALDGSAIDINSVYNNSDGPTATTGNFVINNCAFSNNNSASDGTIYLGTSHAWIIKNSSFCNNSVVDDGAAIYMSDSGSNFIDSCTFSSNIADDDGGALFLNNSSATVNNSLFSENEANPSAQNGGALYMLSSSVQLNYTDFYNNTAEDGGAIYSDGWYDGDLRSTADNCIFYGNESTHSSAADEDGGGAICIVSNSNGWDIDNCFFINNRVHSSGKGGAISNDDAETTLTNSLFYNNQRGTNPNVAHADISNYNNDGGFVFMSGNSMQLNNASSYVNFSGSTDASSYGFTDDDFSNTDDGSISNVVLINCNVVYIEICGNGIDDDYDGLIDGVDSDCSDIDDDSIYDPSDLDNDNDGILDVDEGICFDLRYDFDTSNEGWIEDNFNDGTQELQTHHSSVVTSHNGCSYSTIPSSPSGEYIILEDNYTGEMYFETSGDLNLDASDLLDVGTLSFYWINGTYDGTGSQVGHAANLEVILTGGGISVISTFDVVGLGNTNSWHLFSFDMNDATWSGSLANLTTVLGDLDRIEIQVESYSARDFAAAATCSNGEWFGLDAVHLTCSPLDTDGDSVFDYLDLDSDNDGCPDALEGGGGFDYVDIQNDTLTGGVDSDGVPLAASGGQSFGTSKDNTQQAAICSPCTIGHPDYNDNDGDTIGDFCDIDDDNDGIPDVEEGAICSILDMSSLDGTIATVNDFNAAQINISGAIIQLDPLVFVGTSSGDEFGLNDDHETGSYGLEVGVFSTSPSNYLEERYSFSQNVCDFNARILDIDMGDGIQIFGYLDGIEIPFSVTYLGSCVAFASDNEFTSICLQNASPAFGFVDDHAFDVQFVGCIDSLVLRSYENGTGAGGSHTLVLSPGPTCSAIDTDKDGISDHLDLDSDNDGIFDADEAGHNAADVNDDGVIDGAASTFGNNGLFNGIETVVDNGILNYSISDSEASPDGIYDAYELDADGDSCFDADEQNNTDPDDDGIVGSGTPSVNVNGLVTGYTYTTPSNDFWQDHSIATCLTEICTDGIDNDGDGLVDCDDPDCGVTTIEYYNYQKAYAVVGQDNFTSYSGGLAPDKYNSVKDVLIDPVSNKVFVADAINNRVLRYASFDDFLNKIDPEAVLGQPDFVTGTAATSATGMESPNGLAIASNGDLFVSEYHNNRVIKFANATTIPSGSPADVVLGQPDFTTQPNGLTRTKMYRPNELLIEEDNTLWVSDGWNGRVLRFDNATTLGNGAPADAVLGQTNYTSHNVTIDAIHMDQATGLAMVNGILFVGDYQAERVLIWDDARNRPDGAPADRVLGQPNFNTDSSPLDERHVGKMADLDIDPSNNLFVNDISNDRTIIFYDAPNLTTYDSAEVVLHQPDFTTFLAAPLVSQRKSYNPNGVRYTRQGYVNYLVEAEQLGRRVLITRPAVETDEITSITDTLPGRDLSGQNSAQFEIITQPGQGVVTLDDVAIGEFTYVPPGHCPIDVDTSYTFLYSITNIYGCIDTAEMLIFVDDVDSCIEDCSDGIDNDDDGLVDCDDPDCGVTTIEYYNNQKAIAVVGQDNFTEQTSGTSANKFNIPKDLIIDPATNKVFVADGENNRVLRYASFDDYLNNRDAEAALGQATLTSSAPGLTSSTMNLPNGLVMASNGDLFVSESDNNRVLKFANAATIATGSPADVVLGQPDFTTNTTAWTQTNMKKPSELFIEEDNTLWVADGWNGRVLRFDNATTLGNGAPADVVLGQEDFTSFVVAVDSVHMHVVSALEMVEGVLFAADFTANRVLVWDNAKSKTNGAPADRVLGQPDFNSNSSVVNIRSVGGVSDMDVDPDNNLFVQDLNNNRTVIFYDAPNLNTYDSASIVLHQPDFNTVLGGTDVTQRKSNGLNGVKYTRQGYVNYLVESEQGSHRSLITRPAIETDEITTITDTLPGRDLSGQNSAQFAIITQPGQGAVTLDGVSSGEFTYVPPGSCPIDVDTFYTFLYSISNVHGCIDTAEMLIFVDDVAPCVEICNDGIDNDEDGRADCEDTDCGVTAIDYENYQTACKVVGQPNFTSSSPSTSSTTFNGPQSIVVDPTSGKVFVSDYGNNRVLRYPSVDLFVNGGAAESVLGQNNFTDNGSSVSQSEMHGPTGLAFDSFGSLYVADYLNSRVLRFDNAATLANGANADIVIGQPDFTSDAEVRTQTGMQRPAFLFIEYDGTLWVSDRFNNRVLRFDNAHTLTTGAAADGVLGQVDFVTEDIAGGASILGNAFGITVIDGALYVGTSSTNRILIWNNAKYKPNGAAADRVLGQPDFTTNSTTLSQSSINHPYALSTDKDNTLYVSDLSDDRVLVFLDAPSKANGANADYVLGQPNFTTNSGGTSSRRIDSPTQVAVLDDGHYTYLALPEYTNDRILIWQQAYVTDEVTDINAFLDGRDLSGGGFTNFTMVTQPPYGTVTIDDAATGAFTYSPDGYCMLEADTTITFTYVVNNANGCVDTTNALLKITDVSPPSIALNDPADQCIDGTDMSFTGVPTDSDGVFTTTATSGLTDNGDGTAVLDISAAGAGTYDVTYTHTDSFGCSMDTTVSVTVFDDVPVGLNDPGLVCVTDSDITFTGIPADANGSYVTTASSGFTDNGDGTATLDLSAAGIGTYDVTYSYADAGGCSLDTTVTVGIFQTPTVSNAVGANPTDCDIPDGSITVTASGGSGTIEYRLNGGTWQTSNVFSSLGTGSYNVEVRNDNGTCIVPFGSNPLVLGPPNSPNATIQQPSSSCVGTTVSFTAQNAGGGATYAWDFGAGATPATANTQGPHNVTYATPGNKSVDLTVTRKGCEGMDNVIYIVNALPTVSLTLADDEECENSTSLSLSGGSPAGGEYSGSGVNSITGVFDASSVAVGDHVITYTYTDGNSCVNTATDIMTVVATPNITNITHQDETCDLDNGEITFTFTDQVGRATIEFSIDDGTTWPAAYGASDNSGTFTISNLSPDTYDLWARWDGDDCPIDLGSVEIDPEPTPVISEVLSTAPYNCPALTNGTIFIVATGSNLKYSINNGSSYQTSPAFGNLPVGDYDIAVIDSVTNCIVFSVANPLTQPSQPCEEICFNGIDDDGDGLVDENDPDCDNSCNETVILIAQDGGRISQKNINTGFQNTLTYSPYTTSNLNALAANPDGGLLYYGRGRNVYYWEPTTDVHGVLMDLSPFISSDYSLTSGGGAYYNNYVYMGFEDDSSSDDPFVVRIPVSSNGYLPTGDIEIMSIPLASNLSWGDMIVSRENGDITMYFTNGIIGGGGNSRYSKYNTRTGVYSIISSGMISNLQVGVDINGDLWGASVFGGDIRRFDKATGAFYGPTVSISGEIWDLTGPMNCAQRPEDCTNGIDDDGDGLVDCNDPDCKGDGNADIVFASSGVVTKDEALGEPDGSAALLEDSGDWIILDLTDQLQLGQQYHMTMRKISGGDPTILIEESPDAINWTNATGYPSTVTNATFISTMIVSSSPVRYLRITNQSNQDFAFDAVGYSLACDNFCPTATMNPHIMYFRRN